MDAFLYNLARHFYNHERGNLSQIAFVFPNRRSGKFFQKYLSQVADGKSLFSPTVITINTLLTELSQLQPVDKIELLFVLYEEYCRLRQSDEPFDKFVFWGEILAGDFDDIDKYMVDADKLFANIKDLKDLDQLYLSPEQIAIIQQFWDTFIRLDDDSNKKVEFNSLWNILTDLYNSVRNRLISKGVGYEGVIFRAAAETALSGRMPRLEEMRATYKCNRIVFVGFNAITPAERCVMQYFRDSKVGDFYWDYNAPTLQYEDENRANFFIKQNLKEFPSRYDIDNEHIITSVPEMTVIPVASGIGQVKQAGEILQTLVKEKIVDATNAIDTAVVLPDEELLMPMIYSIPSEYTDINITMGYSLHYTSLASFFETISHMQRRVRYVQGKALFYHVEVVTILNHRIVRQCVDNAVLDRIVATMTTHNMAYVDTDFMAREEQPLLQAIFTPITDNDAGSYVENLLSCILDNMPDTAAPDEDGKTTVAMLEREYTYHYYNVVSRLNDVVAQYNSVAMNATTYFLLLGKLSLSIPFVGEPLSGLQVMGVLETRVLDFDNIIILSMNEGVFPKKRNTGSLIPYNLRRGFGMATTEHQDSIYAYYFYRMIARAKRVYMLYDSRTDGLNRGEMSRFIYQLKYHYSHLLSNHIDVYSVHHSVQVDKPPVISIAKTDGVAQRLCSFLRDGSGNARALSASSLKTYLNCPLQFYLTHVEGMSVEDEITENVDSSAFGTIYHNVMAGIYNDLCQKYGTTNGDNRLVANITETILREVLADEDSIMERIEYEFNRTFYHADKRVRAPKLTGKNYIIGRTVLSYVKRTLQYDCENFAPFIYYASEERLDGELYLPLSNGNAVRFKAFIDRMDYRTDKLRIIDYKTGSDQLSVSSMEELFDPLFTKNHGAILQVLLYCRLYLAKYPHSNMPLQPLIYKVRQAFSDFVPDLKIGGVKIASYDDVKDRYEELLTALLDEIFNLDIPFGQTQVLEHCKYCNFKTICKRKE